MEEIDTAPGGGEGQVQPAPCPADAPGTAQADAPGQDAPAQTAADSPRAQAPDGPAARGAFLDAARERAPFEGASGEQEPAESAPLKEAPAQKDGPRAQAPAQRAPDEERRRAVQAAGRRLCERLQAGLMASPQLAAQAQALEGYRERERQARFESDLRAIREAWPDEQATDVCELGDDFLALCAGGVTPLVAYEAVRAQAARSEHTPPGMGDVAGGASRERDYFSREEVRAMSPAEVRRNFDRIRKSQMRWGR